MKVPKIPLAQTIIQLCKAKEVKHIVISPGSRNAPLTIGFTNHNYFKCYSIVDERSAAFFALGIAQQSNEPVALVCTSGSALLNYYPAVAEAYYSDIPLIVISADRPANLIGVGDGQTINQKDVYKNHILYSANLKEDGLEEGHNFNNVEINTAINTAIVSKGPVHINAPFNEPLYDMIDEFSITAKNVPIETSSQSLKSISEYKDIWNRSSKKMVLVGVLPPNSIEEKYLELLANDNSVIVFTETTSNLHHNEFFPSIDKIIAPLENGEFKALQPEVLLTLGGLVVSKKIKAFLREYTPQHHWHVDEKKANDTFFCLDKHFKCSADQLFGLLLEDSLLSDYKSNWSQVKERRHQLHEQYLETIPYSDLKVFESILESLPKNANIQVSNSSAIRYLQLFDIEPSLKVYCNRGTSGIDGSTSTAIGASIVTNEPTILITGDLSFFYDSNALWNNYIPSNFRIVMINNGGGGIFRILPGHKNTENFDTYFETKHDLTAEQLCKIYGFEYTSANNLDEIKNNAPSFYALNNTPKLLEIFTPRQLNDEVLLDYFKAIK